MSKLQITNRYGTTDLDEFYKSLVFQYIMDGNFSRDERDVMLVIFRKTLHFDKWDDHLGIHWLSKSAGMCESKLRKTLKQLEEKSLIEIVHSKGGRRDSNKKFSKFSLSDELIFLVLDKWEEIKLAYDS